MNKEQKEKLKEFKKSCEFYCNYHNVGKIETTMICGNLEQVVLKIIESIKENE